MCMICKGLTRNKFTPEDAREKLEEFVDLELLDEDHQEIVESLIAEAEEEEYYWISAKQNTLKIEDHDKSPEFDEYAEDDYVEASEDDSEDDSYE